MDGPLHLKMLIECIHANVNIMQQFYIRSENKMCIFSKTTMQVETTSLHRKFKCVNIIFA